jgi:broad specificity phosphatase PhoE
VDHKLAQGIGRRRWVLSGILVIVALLCLIPLLPGAAVQTTTVYVVRHAEKADNTANPPLSAAGQARAQELARVLGDDEIDAIFVTSFIRTQQTGAPVAAANGIQVEQYPAGNAQSVVDTILADHVGDRVLVVGHSNTVDDIAAGLGAGGLSDLGEDQFDRLFVIHRLGNVTHLDRLRFGAEAP